ncbi:MAG: TlpA family protein disulfide reductase [Gaiellales bacterium]
MLTVIAISGRVVLAAVFVVAGVAKLRDRGGTRSALAAFGAPARLVSAAAVVLPVAELATAGLLLPSTTALVGAAVAAGLLLLFTAVVGRSLARGDAPDCRCFGQLRSKPIGRRTLVRNILLLAISGVAVVGTLVEPAESPVAWIGHLDASGGAIVALAVALAVTLSAGSVVLMSVMRSYGRVLVRLERVEALLADAGFDVGRGETEPFLGLEPGTEAPWFLATTAEGRAVSRDDLLVDAKPLLLLFTSPHCGPCQELLPLAATWQHEHADTLTVAFASSGTADAVRAEAAEHGLVHALVDETSAIAETFQSAGTPSAVLVSGDGTIRSWLATGLEAIESLVATATTPPPGLPIGAEVPSLELETLAGEPFALSELHGRDTVLLFWNPGCGYCRAMHDDIVAFEKLDDPDAPRLVIVSSGDREDTAGEGFRSPVLLDRSFAAGTAFDATGTPMGVMLGGDGRVASEVAAGADAVFTLLGAPPRHPAAR